MKKSLTLSKITQPQPAQVLARTPLFRQLDRARKYPLVWISSPAGAGKTTLASSYLKNRKLRSLWYQIDTGDRDIAAFFHYLGLAAKTAAPHKRKPLPHLTPEYFPGLSTFTRRYFQELYSRLSPSSAVVFDNYQDIGPDTLLNQVLGDAMAVIPKGINVLVLSRTEPPPELARLRANGEMFCMGWEELRLTLEESAAIGKLRGKKKLPETLVQKLHAYTHGWTAGLVLLLEQLSRQAEWPHTLDTQEWDTVFDYFAGEILQQTDAKTQAFLLKTAFLPEITVEMAEQVSDERNSAHILADLHHRNYFTSKHDNPLPVYRYHPLFRTFLVNRAHARFDRQTVIATQRAAAKCLIVNGQVENALDLLQQSADWETLAALIIEHAPRWLQEGRHQTLAARLQAMPQTARDHQPWLTYWLGVCGLPSDPRASNASFEQAFKQFEDRADAIGLLLAWSGAVDAILFSWDDFTKMDRWISWLGERLRQNMSFPTPEIEARVATSMAGALVYRQPQHPEIGVWIKRALRLSHATADISLRIQANTFAVIYYLFMGDMSQGLAAADALRHMARGRDASPLVVTTWKWVEASYHWMVGRPEASLESVSEGLAVAAATGVHIWDHMLFAEGVYGSLNGGEIAKAGEYLKNMELTLNTTQPHMIGHYHYLTAWYALTLGEFPRAVTHAEMAVKLVIETGTPFPEAICRLALAQAYFEAGVKKEAVYQLSLARDLISRLKSLLFEYACLLAEAQFALDQGEKPAALAALAKAMIIGKEKGYVGLFTWRPASMARLYALALENGIEVAHVQHLIRRSHLALDEPPIAIDAWPWAVKIYTFGQFALELDGKPVSVTRRSGIGKPLALLKALIALGGRTVSQSALTEALWPEAEGDSARRTFDTTLHRLRKLLPENALTLEDGKLQLNTHAVWIDTKALGWELERLEQVLKSGALLTPAQLNTYSQSVLRLYRGPFLPEEDASWALAPREQWQLRMLQLLRRLGRYCEDQGTPEAALIYYEQGLALDPCIEEFYQRLMRLYQRLGRQAEAVAIYIRCRKTLHALLQITPSPTTERLYQDLRKS